MLVPPQRVDAPSYGESWIRPCLRTVMIPLPIPLSLVTFIKGKNIAFTCEKYTVDVKHVSLFNFKLILVSLQKNDRKHI